MSWLKQIFTRKSTPRMEKQPLVVLPSEMSDDVALCRCVCGALLKVLSLPIGCTIECPSCGNRFLKPAEGPHTEPFSGVLLTVMVAATKMLIQSKKLARNPVCDHCHTPTPRADGFVASRELMIRSDLAALFPRMAGVERLRASFPGKSDTELIKYFGAMVAIDPKPWLLCHECAAIVFASVVQDLLSVSGTAELWDRSAMHPEVRDFFPDYQKNLPGEMA